MATTVVATSTIPGPTAGRIRTFTFTGTSGQVTGLAAVTSYIGQVRARDAAGNWSAYSDPVPFTTGVGNATVAPAAVAATAVIPTPGPAAGIPRTFTFTGTGGQVTGLTPGGSYTAQVRAVDAAGNRSALSTPVSFTTAAAGPGTVAGVASVPPPTGGLPSSASRAPVTVAAAAGIPTPTMDAVRTFTLTFTGTSGQVTGLVPGGEYTAQVRARDAAGNRSGYSNPITFTASGAMTVTPAAVAATAAIPAPNDAGAPPTVIDGTARPVGSGGSVSLDVTASPPAGQSIAWYSWAIVSGGGTLSNVTAATPTYTAPGPGSGVAVIRATVTASGGGVAAAEVTVSYGPTVVAAENALAGTARATWDLTSPNLGGVDTLQGFCDGFTADKTETVTFKIAQSDGAGWSADVYRLGWYGGNGARFYGTLTPTGPQLAASQAQPAPGDADPNTTLPSADCGNWAATLTWTPPAWAPSGIYLLRLNRTGGGASHVMFIVRDDNRAADLMLMPSDSTWNAYNAFGGMGANLYAGNSLYLGTAVNQYDADCARFVSYNRPTVNRGSADTGRSYGAVEWSTFFTGEYPMLRFLERNGYDVKYYGCIDAAGDSTGAKLATVSAAMAVGHNEYWSDGMRAGWETAKADGTNLFFCASNEVFWRLVGSNADSSGRPRMWECFKSSIAARGSTGRPEWTGTWRDPDGAGKGGNAPENTLTGTIFVVNGPDLRSLVVPADGNYSTQPIWRHTTVASLTSGQSWTSESQILGFEWDTYGPLGTSGAGGSYMADPHPRARYCSDVTYTVTGPLLIDAGDEYGSGTATHRLVVHPGGNGGIVFGTGTINWAFGVDSAHTYQVGGDNTSPVIQQATVNMLADMGADAATLMAGLTAPTPVDWYVDVPAGTVTAQASVPAPTITAVQNATLMPGTVTAVATVAAVTVSAEAADSRAPAPVAAVTSVPAPTVKAGTGTAVTPAAVAATATVPAAAVHTSRLAIPATVSATTTIPKPAISAGHTVTLTTVAGKAAIAAPALRITTLAKPTSVKALAAVPKPVVVATSTATLTPATVTAWTAIPPPTAVGKVPPKTGPARVYVTSQPAAARITSATATVRITSP